MEPRSIRACALYLSPRYSAWILPCPSRLTVILTATLASIGTAGAGFRSDHAVHGASERGTSAGRNRACCRNRPYPGYGPDNGSILQADAACSVCVNAMESLRRSSRQDNPCQKTAAQALWPKFHRPMVGIRDLADDQSPSPWRCPQDREEYEAWYRRSDHCW